MKKIFFTVIFSLLTRILFSQEIADNFIDQITHFTEDWFLSKKLKGEIV